LRAVANGVRRSAGAHAVSAGSGDALTEALAALEPLVVDSEHVLLGYERGTAPPSPDALAAESFAVRIDDPFETTFVLRVALADALPEPAVRIGPLRAIVLTGELSPDLTGFMSTLAGALAERGIPIVPIGAATRDTLLVPTASWPEALAILRGLRDAARTVLGSRDEPL
jgi:hypothetical protein